MWIQSYLVIFIILGYKEKEIWKKYVNQITLNGKIVTKRNKQK